MNVDQVFSEWAERDRRLEQAIQVNTALLRNGLMDQGRAEIRRHASPGVFSVLVSVACLVLLGAFNAAHVGQWRFFLPGVMLQVWVAVVLALQIQQRLALTQVDFSRPVVALQRELLALKIRRLTILKWSLLTGQVVWFVPFLVVLFKGVLGVDLFAVSASAPRFLALNVGVGLLFIPVAVWLARRVGQRFAGSAVFQRWTDALAGGDVVAARGFLEKLAQFEKAG